MIYKLSITFVLFSSWMFAQAPTPVPYAVNGYGQVPTVFVNLQILATPTPTPVRFSPLDVPDLIAWYKLDEGSGIDVHDASVNNHDGVLVEIDSGAVYFNSYGMHTVSPKTGGITITSPFDFSGDTTIIIVNKCSSAGTLYHKAAVTCTYTCPPSDGHWNVSLGTSFNTTALGCYSNAWHYMEVKVASGVCSFYKDGVAGGSGACGTPGAAGTNNYLGWNGAHAAYEMYGDWATFIFYDRAISAFESSGIHNYIKDMLVARSITLP